MKQDFDERNSGDDVKMEYRSVYRVEVLSIHPLNRLLDPKDPEDVKDIPYKGTDMVLLNRPYQVYVLSWSEVMRIVRDAVDTQESLYSIRVYDIPLNVRITDSESFESLFDMDETLQVRIHVFNSKGEEMVMSANNVHNPGEVVEYCDFHTMHLELAIIYQSPNCSKEIDEANYRVISSRGYKLRIPACDVSAPSFPVSETFRKELKDLFRKKRELVKKRQLLVTERSAVKMPQKKNSV